MKTTIKKLKQAVDDYLLWMISSGYADETIKKYEQILNHFVDFTRVIKLAGIRSFLQQIYTALIKAQKFN